MLNELRAVAAAQGKLEEVAKALAYLEKRQEQMRYGEFAAQGWPLGSGMVESANKLVVEDRLKGSGMHWAEGNVNPMLALRNAWCNRRWEERWKVIEREVRRQLVVRRVQRQSRRTRAPVPPTPSAAVVAERAAPAATPPAPTTKPPHPWKRAWSIRRQRELAGAA